MGIRQASRVYTTLFALVAGLQFLPIEDFGVPPAFARYNCDDFWYDDPDPDELIWLPYRTYCERFQTMPSNPSLFRIDDYPEEDLPNCNELGTAWILESRDEDSRCGIEALPGYTTYITFEVPLSCNGNINFPQKQYMFSAFGEGTRQDFNVLCPGYPPNPISWSVATKYYVREPVGPGDIIESKNLGSPACGLTAGNPVNIATGNKFHPQNDASLPGGLEISRYYNSKDNALRSFGVGWRGRYSRNIHVLMSGTGLHGSLSRVGDDGQENFWRIADGQLTPPPDAGGKLDIAYDGSQVLGYTYVDRKGAIETYGPNGRLLSLLDENGQLLNFEYSGQLLTRVVASTGRQLAFTHDEDGRVSAISSSDGSTWAYFYSADGNLERVEYPGGDFKIYHYEDPNFVHALTGETDENGVRARSWAYDDSGRAILSTFGEPGSNVERHEISYHPDGTTTTVGPLDRSTDHEFEAIHGSVKFGTSSDACAGCGNSASSTTYDLHGNRDRVTDASGRITDYDYSAENLPEKITYAVGTPEQFEVLFTWDADLRKPLQRVQGNRTTDYTYNARGQVLTRIESDTKTFARQAWTNHYFEAPSAPALVGKLQSTDGPRSDIDDVTEYEYYANDDPGGAWRAGDLKAIVNPLGQRTEFLAYDGNGRLRAFSDINGVETWIEYNPRGLPASYTIAGETTRFDFDNVGNLVAATGPGGGITVYRYDAFGRLIAIEDGSGNRIEYTLDASGNRVSERISDDLGTLRRQLDRVFDSLGNLEAVVDGMAGQTLFTYDESGRVTSQANALSQTTHYQYDGLGRLSRVIDPLLGETVRVFDSIGHPVSVTDPAGHVTEYTFDSLGNQLRIDSPDTGLTVQEYDEAGNRVARTDGRGVRTDFTYDALNRLTAISYPDSSLDVGYTYDQGEFGKGHLTRMTDSTGVTDYSYDARGNLVREVTVMDGQTFVTSYRYDEADRLVQIVYPSGMAIDYELNAYGQILSVEKGGALTSETLIFDVEYAPFGPVTSFSYGNGTRYAASLDLDYRVDSLQSGPGLEWVLEYDPAGQIRSIDDRVDSRISQQFQLDPASRLESAQGAYGSRAFNYDANGNRTLAVSGTTEEVYGYDPASNRLASQGSWTLTRDAAGNRIEKIDDAGNGFRSEYGDHNRLSAVSALVAGADSTTTTYRYNGKGQRSRKTMVSGDTFYVFGPAGELIGEYSSGNSGTSVEYVYLGDLPVATVKRWSEEIVPPGQEWILDNGDPATSGSGDWQNMTSTDAYEGDYLFAKKASGRSYRWTTTLPDIRYEVFAWWVDKKNQAADVRYTILYGPDESDTVTASHKTGGGQWQSLGQFRTGGGENTVEVSSGSSKFIADAVRWVELTDPVQTWFESTHFIHFDHLGTPRRITDQGGILVWQWDSSPFGNSPPDEDPDGDSKSLTFNLRFPGQYFDAESGLHYNYFRTYDPGTGRYVESDPIGLRGALNTYSYTGSDPLNSIDPSGLIKIYGSWCGPDWTGGFRKSYDELGAAERSAVLPPIDVLDQCCKTHDISYAKCRSDFPCDRDSRQRCFQNADQDLSNCAANAGSGQSRTMFLGKTPGKSIANFFNGRIPPAEDNAASCECEK